MKSIRNTLAILALCLAFPGSAIAFGGFGVVADWQPVATHQALPAMHFVVAEDDLSRVCKTNPNGVTYGCAIRVPQDNLCLIYTAKNPPQWLMEHERKHCEGWDHSGDSHTRVAALEMAQPAN
ncbi:MAG TPA: hypothetical protein VFV90_06695 [Usitatibacter sp.]|nr:hypothetical protein [Usitatibacter sp.]